MELAKSADIFGSGRQAFGKKKKKMRQKRSEDIQQGMGKKGVVSKIQNEWGKRVWSAVAIDLKNVTTQRVGVFCLCVREKTTRPHRRVGATMTV